MSENNVSGEKMDVLNFELHKELGKNGQIFWVVLYAAPKATDSKIITHYSTRRACIGYLMTVGKILSKKMVKPGYYKIKVGVTEPAQAALEQLLR